MLLPRAQSAQPLSNQSGGTVPDLRRLIRLSAVYGIGSSLSSVLTVALLPVFTRLLGRDGFGVIAITGSLSAVLVVVNSMGLSNAAIRFWHDVDDEDRRRHVIGSVWVFSIVNALAVTIVAYATIRLWAVWFISPAASQYAGIVVWTSFFLSTQGLPLAALRAQDLAFSHALARVGLAVGDSLIALGFMLFIERSARGYLMGLLVSSALSSVALAILMARSVPPKWDAATMVGAFRFGVPLAVNALALWALDLGDRLILQRYVAVAQIGVYALGYRVGNIVLSVASAVNAAWMTYYYRVMKAEGGAAPAKLQRMVSYYAFGFIYLSVGIIVTGRGLVALLAPPQFAAAASIVPIIVVAQLFRALYLIPSGALMQAHRTSLIGFATLFAAMLNVTLNLTFAPHFGILASAWATLVAFGVMLVLAWFYARGITPFMYELPRICGAAGLGALCVFADWLVQPRFVAVAVLYKLTLILAFPVFLVMSRVVSRDERYRLLHSIDTWRKSLPFFGSRAGQA